MLVYHVDAFAQRPFAGNPAGVCLLSQPCDDSWMHSLALELNLPKTAFVLREGADQSFRLRWFGMDGESQLCGHATLAAAHVLWQSALAPPAEPIRFLTASGTLRARQLGAGWIELDFPAEVAVEESRPELAAALGVEPRWMGRNRFHFLVEVESEAAVRAVQPDFRRLAAVLSPAHGVSVTARATGARKAADLAPADLWARHRSPQPAQVRPSPKGRPGGDPPPSAPEPAGTAGEIDFVSRFFAPPIGVDEDAVTGSAHCALGPYWAAKLGKLELSAYQASARGGALRVRVAGDRVFLAGQAVSLLRSEILQERES
jgi:predicted PhzF superfamily epimerase YddE/YHI9